MPRTKLYYTLLVRDGDKFDGPWVIEFGSYDRQDCKDEMDAMHHGYNDVPYKAMRIISTGDKQADILARVDELNAALKEGK